MRLTAIENPEDPSHDVTAAPETEGATPLPAETSIARNSFHLFLGQIATILLSFVLNWALGRWLGVVDFGNLYLVMRTVWFAYLFVEWGQGQYVIREVARSPDKAGVILGSSLVFRSAASFLVCGPALFAAWFFGYGPSIILLTGLFMLANLPQSCAQVYGLVFRGRERMDQDALVTVTMKFLTVAFTLLALVLGGQLLEVILAQSVAGLGALGLAALLAKRVPVPGMRATLAAGRELLLKGAATLPLNIASFAQPYIDVVVLKKLATATTVGWYGAAMLFMNALLMPAVILGSAAYPRLSRAAHEPELFRKELSTAFRPLLIIGAFAAAGTYLFADLAVGIVYDTSKFGPAITVLQVFAPALFLLFVDIVLATAILAVGRPKPLAIAKTAVLLLAAVLDWLLVPIAETRWGNGGIGVVLSFSASELVMLIAALIFVPRGSLDKRLLFDLARVLTVTGIVLFGIGLLPPIAPLLRLPLFLAAFGTLSILFGVVHRGDLTILRSFLPRLAAGTKAT
jgi:O-antigen/teichoic acid export membrane protein